MIVRYELLDVFTNEPFGGNQLAVVADARGIPESLMPRIAKELNLSETTFVLPPADPAHDCRVRIFTPARELPFAGHPTIGTAFARHRASGSTGAARYVFEEGVGPIVVSVLPREGLAPMVQMEQPLPAFGATVGDPAPVAAALGIEIADLALDRAPVQTVSSGVPFLYVPVRSLEVMARLRLRADLVEQLLGPEGHALFVWTAETERAGSHAHARMFAPRLGITEDPATGSANGPFAAYLLKHGVVRQALTVRIVTEQGFEMGRPSILVAEVEHAAGVVTAVRVGGECVWMGHGELEIAA